MSATVATSESFSSRQLTAIEDTERACSVLSLLGTTFISASFICSTSFRKPINRLVFYASWGNTMANIATLISRSGVHHGVGGPLCQFQAFFIQWFMLADALWIFCMACNVYLTIFHKYDASNLRALEWKQIILAYGLPLIPAFVLLFIKTESRSNVYGSAILWCWIRPEWDFLRIVTFYGPAWLVIFMTSGIYIMVGKEIFDKRRQLRHISWVTDARYPEHRPKDIVVHSEITKTSASSEPTAAHQEYANGSGVPFDERLNTPSQASPNSYTFSVNSGRLESRQFDRGSSFQSDRSPTSGQHRRTSLEANKAAWAYTKCASLFFLSLVVTWVPSTINRVYAFAQPDAHSFALNYFSSFVLPLQGFWNCIIYIAFSFPACKKLFYKVFPCIRRRTQPDNENLHSETTRSDGGWTPHIVSHRSTESTVELNTV